MKFKIIVGHQTAEIGEDEISEALEAINKGEIVALRHIIFNPSYFEAIIRDMEAEERMLEEKRYGIKEKTTSDFAKALNKPMLSSKERDNAMIEASTEERRRK